MSKRFVNMPLNSYLTVVGQVKRRPNNLRNLVSSFYSFYGLFSLLLPLLTFANKSFSLQSIPTGDVEVHVDNIIRVQRIYRPDPVPGFIPTGKR